MKQRKVTVQAKTALIKSKMPKRTHLQPAAMAAEAVADRIKT